MSPDLNRGLAAMETKMNVTQTVIAFPNHVAIVPNGNRRGSVLARIPLVQAYRKGAERALDIARCAQELGVQHMTFFGLAIQNKQNRPGYQIDALIEGAIHFCDRAMELGYALHPFGYIDEFEGVEKYKPLYVRLKRLREEYQPSSRFTIHVAANYSGVAKYELEPLMESLYCRGFSDVRPDPMRYVLSGGVPDVDLFIRTGGERRISGLLPFQCNYAELYFTDVLWSDFTVQEFHMALEWFASQQRNFGK